MIDMTEAKKRYWRRGESVDQELSIYASRRKVRRPQSRSESRYAGAGDPVEELVEDHSPSVAPWAMQGATQGLHCLQSSLRQGNYEFKMNQDLVGAAKQVRGQTHDLRLGRSFREDGRLTYDQRGIADSRGAIPLLIFRECVYLTTPSDLACYCLICPLRDSTF